MVVAERDVGRLLTVESAVALHLVGIGARIAVEEVAVVHPDVLVVLLQTHVVAFPAVHVHDAEVADFHVLRVLDTDAPAVRGRIHADALDGERRSLLLAEVHQNVALVGGIRIRDVPDNADVERARVVALLVTREDGLQALARGRRTLAARDHIERNRVLGAFGNVDDHRAILERAVLLVGARQTAVAVGKTAAVVRLHGESLRRGRSTFLAALHARDFQRVVARLEARDVHAPLGAVLAHELRVHLRVGGTVTRVVHVVAVGTVRCPFRIGRFEPAARIAHRHLRARHGHKAEASKTRKRFSQTFHTSIPFSGTPRRHFRKCSQFSTQNIH